MGNESTTSTCGTVLACAGGEREGCASGTTGGGLWRRLLSANFHVHSNWLPKRVGRPVEHRVGQSEAIHVGAVRQVDKETHSCSVRLLDRLQHQPSPSISHHSPGKTNFLPSENQSSALAACASSRQNIHPSLVACAHSDPSSREHRSTLHLLRQANHRISDKTQNLAL